MPWFKQECSSAETVFVAIKEWSGGRRDLVCRKLAALKELEQLLDARIRAAQAGAVSRRTVSEVFTEVVRKKAR